MSNTNWFLEAMKNALAVGHLTKSGFANLMLVQEAIERENEGDFDDFRCPVCGRDCRDAFGAPSRECRADYNAD